MFSVENFGPEVTNMVREVTDDKTKSKAERKLHQIEEAKHASLGARMIKYGDKIANMTDIMGHPLMYYYFLFILSLEMMIILMATLFGRTLFSKVLERLIKS